MDGNYCCKSAGFLNALNCVNVLNGNSINIPISIGLKGRDAEKYDSLVLLDAAN